jgi:hypothetical protein
MPKDSELSPILLDQLGTRFGLTCPLCRRSFMAETYDLVLDGCDLTCPGCGTVWHGRIMAGDARGYCLKTTLLRKGQSQRS